MIPCHGRACDAEDEADGSANERVLHGVARSQARRDVSAENSEERSVHGGQKKERIRHRMAESGEDACCAQGFVRPDGKNDNHDKSSDDGESAAAYALVRCIGLGGRNRHV
jgi:hypothetical protein